MARFAILNASGTVAGPVALYSLHCALIEAPQPPNPWSRTAVAPKTQGQCDSEGNGKRWPQNGNSLPHGEYTQHQEQSDDGRPSCGGECAVQTNLFQTRLQFREPRLVLRQHLMYGHVCLSYEEVTAFVREKTLSRVAFRALRRFERWRPRRCTATPIRCGRLRVQRCR